MITRDQVLQLFPTGAAAARAMGITRQAVREWKGSDKPVPPAHALPIVRAVHGRVTPHQLRPDLYPDPDWLPPDLAQSDPMPPATESGDEGPATGAPHGGPDGPAAAGEGGSMDGAARPGPAEEAA